VRNRWASSAARPPPRVGPGQRRGPRWSRSSRDGKRVYLTNSLYAAWGRAVLPRGDRRLGWSSSTTTAGPSSSIPRFLSSEFDGPSAPHQIRLEGGDGLQRLLLLPVVDLRRRVADPGRARRLPRASTRPWAGSSPSSRGIAGSRSRRAVLRVAGADRDRPTRPSIALRCRARPGPQHDGTDPHALADRSGGWALVAFGDLPLRQAARATSAGRRCG